MKLNGVNELQVRFKKLSAKAERDINDRVRANAYEIASEATSNAPKIYQYSYGGTQPTNGEIGQSITVDRVTASKYKVSVNSKMGAYAEFGTGVYVDVPQGWNSIAWSYYVNGKGLLLPQPFLYPAFRKGKERFLKDLQNYINRIDD